MNQHRLLRLTFFSGLSTFLLLIALWAILRPPIVYGNSAESIIELGDLFDQQAAQAQDTHIYLPIIQYNLQRIGDVDISLSMQSSTGMPNSAFNGETITYTILITNNSNLAAQNIRLEDILPIGSLSQIECLQTACSKEFITTTYNDPSSVTYSVTTTTKLKWEWAGLEAKGKEGSRQKVQFKAKIIGQSNGAALNNRAVLIFTYANGDSGLRNADLLATVKVQVNVPRDIGLSSDPSWISVEPAAATGLDWGDFDLDGDLDLALATSLQLAVYRNNNGTLEPFWSAPRRIYDVKWIQKSSGSPLALVAIGDINPQQPKTGQNYLYTWEEKILAGPDIFKEQIFGSNWPLARLAAANFDQQPGIDIAVSAVQFDVDPSVQLLTDISNTAQVSPSPVYSEVSKNQALALQAIDANGDGKPDLSIGMFPVGAKVLINSGNAITNSESINISDEDFAPYDLAWKDYTNDTKPDVAIAYPLLGEIHLYTNHETNNETNFSLQQPILRLNGLPTTYALDWADINFDGYPDLISVGTKPDIFEHTGVLTSPFTVNPTKEIPVDGDFGRVWGIRAADVNNDGSMEVAVASRDRPALLLPNLSLPLASIAYSLPNLALLPATTVVWADINNDGFQDLLFGAGSANSASSDAFDAKLFANSQLPFGKDTKPFLTSFKPLLNTGLGPHLIKTADVTGKDDFLEVALATSSEIRLYATNKPNFIDADLKIPFANTTAFAWGDMNGDGWLDLAAASSNAGIVIFINQRGTLSTIPLSISPLNSVTALAWGDFNNDHYLDLVASASSDNAQLFLNQNGNRFEKFSLPAATFAATTLAVADYNNDSWFDIAIGTDTGKVTLLPNRGLPSPDSKNLLFPSDIELNQLIGTETSKVTSLVWGDVDNDKDLDLAVAYDSGKLQVFANFTGNLLRAWESRQVYTRTRVAWGDADHDGDLDLAFSQDDGKQSSGYIENRYTYKPLVQSNEPSSIWIASPDGIGGSTAYVTSRILSGPKYNVEAQRYEGKPVTITFEFTAENYDAATRAIQITPYLYPYLYSLNGGSQWQRATSLITPSIILTTNNKFTGQFIWDAYTDKAISDDVRFRVQIIHPHHEFLPAQRASTSANSPSFRVRSVSCLWPTNPQITFLSPEKLTELPPKLDLFGTFDPTAGGAGRLRFDWHVQGITLTQASLSAIGQRVTLPITFTSTTTNPASIQFSVALTVTGEACPVARPAVTTSTVSITLSGRPASVLASEVTTNNQMPQIHGVHGLRNSEPTGTLITWDAYPEDRPISGYHIYATTDQSSNFELLAVLPVGITRYVDQGVVCGRNYYVTAFDAGSESDISTESYYSGVCDP